MPSLYLIALALALGSASARAAPDCDALFGRNDFPPFKNYVLVFLNLNSSGMSAAQRSQLRLQLEDRINPQLADFTRKLWEKNGAQTRFVELVACDAPLGAADLGSSDRKTLKRYGVIAAVWRSLDAMTYLTFPFYSSQSNIPREQAEVVLGYKSKASDPATAWAEVLQQSQQAREAFVALGMALVLIDKEEFIPAWITLCESKKALAKAADDAVRPPKDELLKRIGGLIDKEIGKVAQAVRGASAVGSFKLPLTVQQSCNPPLDVIVATPVAN